MFRWLFRSGWGRLFLASWPLWMWYRDYRLEQGEDYWLPDWDIFPSGSETEWWVTAVTLPPMLLFVARWVARGFDAPVSAAPSPRR